MKVDTFFSDLRSDEKVKIENMYVKKIMSKIGKEYIKKNHYSKGSHNGMVCYGLFIKIKDKLKLFGEDFKLIGVLGFATPCSEAVRESVFGKEYKDTVTELHRLHILDNTQKNTESWFISKCLNLLKKDNPKIKAIISFADYTQKHKGIIYQASNFFYCGKTSKAIFYIDPNGRLRHPRQSGINITPEEANKRNWVAKKMESKYRYIYIISSSKKERRELLKLCKYNLIIGNYPK